MKIDYIVNTNDQSKKLILVAESEAESYQLQCVSEFVGCDQMFPAFLSFELK